MRGRLAHIHTFHPFNNPPLGCRLLVSPPVTVSSVCPVGRGWPRRECGLRRRGLWDQVRVVCFSLPCSRAPQQHDILLLAAVSIHAKKVQSRLNLFAPPQWSERLYIYTYDTEEVSGRATTCTGGSYCSHTSSNEVALEGGSSCLVA